MLFVTKNDAKRESVKIIIIIIIIIIIYFVFET